MTQNQNRNSSIFAQSDDMHHNDMARPHYVVWTSFVALFAFLGGTAFFLGHDPAKPSALPLAQQVDETTTAVAPPTDTARPQAEIAIEEQGSAADTDNAITAEAPLTPEPNDLASLDGSEDSLKTIEEPLIQPRLQTVTVKSGATLMSTLMKAGLERPLAYEVVQGLTKVFDPRRLRAGQKIELTWIPEIDSNEILTSVAMKIDAVTNIVAVRTTDDRFAAEEIISQLQKSESNAKGMINSSLYVSARDAGMPDSVILELINIYSFDVDFQWEVRQGDKFRVVYDQFHDEDGILVKNGTIRYAELTLSGDKKPLYFYTDSKGEEGYFNHKGFSARKALLRMPVSGARLSSGFGKRRHPILGYSKMHKGADYAAPKGTPIKAAGAGVIVASGWNGGYGKYIRIRHNDTFQTAYAHMNAIRRGMSKGARVKQGQIIGYVGTTGRSTGPHLHYEVLKHGRQVNPLKVKMPTGRKLKGNELARFQQEMKKADQRMAMMFSPTIQDQAAQIKPEAARSGSRN